MNKKELIDKINSILINKLKFLYDTTKNHYFNEIEEVKTNEEDEEKENYVYRFLISVLEEETVVKIKFYKINLENEEILTEEKRKLEFVEFQDLTINQIEAIILSSLIELLPEDINF